MFSFPDVTDSESNSFLIDLGRKDNSWYNYNGRLEIWFSLSIDVQQVERSVYNYLTLLGDVGGLYGILMSFAGLALGILNYNKFENNLA